RPPQLPRRPHPPPRPAATPRTSRSADSRRSTTRPRITVPQRLVTILCPTVHAARVRGLTPLRARRRCTVESGADPVLQRGAGLAPDPANLPSPWTGPNDS